MKVVNAILLFLRKKGTAAKGEAPEGFCPNCWGRQEYEGNFLEAIKNNKVDVNSKYPAIGWIQEYVEKNLSAIELKPKDDLLVCQKCKVTYRPT